MNPITRIFNLNNPEQAREFLNALYLGDKKVGSVTVESGREILFSEMSDHEACYYAKELYSMQSWRRWRGMDVRTPDKS